MQIPAHQHPSTSSTSPHDASHISSEPHASNGKHHHPASSHQNATRSFPQAVSRNPNPLMSLIRNAKSSHNANNHHHGKNNRDSAVNHSTSTNNKTPSSSSNNNNTNTSIFSSLSQNHNNQYHHSAAKVSNMNLSLLQQRKSNTSRRQTDHSATTRRRRKRKKKPFTFFSVASASGRAPVETNNSSNNKEKDKSNDNPGDSNQGKDKDSCDTPQNMESKPASPEEKTTESPQAENVEQSKPKSDDINEAEVPPVPQSPQDTAHEKVSEKDGVHNTEHAEPSQTNSPETKPLEETAHTLEDQNAPPNLDQPSARTSSTVIPHRLPRTRLQVQRERAVRQQHQQKQWRDSRAYSESMFLIEGFLQHHGFVDTIKQLKDERTHKESTFTSTSSPGASSQLVYNQTEAARNMEGLDLQGLILETLNRRVYTNGLSSDASNLIQRMKDVLQLAEQNPSHHASVSDTFHSASKHQNNHSSHFSQPTNLYPTFNNRQTVARQPTNSLSTLGNAGNVVYIENKPVFLPPVQNTVPPAYTVASGRPALNGRMPPSIPVHSSLPWQPYPHAQTARILPSQPNNPTRRNTPSDVSRSHTQATAMQSATNAAVAASNPMPVNNNVTTSSSSTHSPSKPRPLTTANTPNPALNTLTADNMPSENLFKSPSSMNMNASFFQTPQGSKSRRKRKAPPKRIGPQQRVSPSPPPASPVDDPLTSDELENFFLDEDILGTMLSDPEFAQNIADRINGCIDGSPQDPRGKRETVVAEELAPEIIKSLGFWENDNRSTGSPVPSYSSQNSGMGELFSSPQEEDFNQQGKKRKRSSLFEEKSLKRPRTTFEEQESENGME